MQVYTIEFAYLIVKVQYPNNKKYVHYTTIQVELLVLFKQTV